jgi:diguanylate cyclase (GGDEF)-like protein
MIGTEPSGQDELRALRRPASPLVARERVVERAGHLDEPARPVAALVVAVLLATAIFRSAWAFLPLGILVATVAVGPLAVRRGARPQVTEAAFSLLLTIAMATAAGLSGATSSPIVFLLPIGVVLNARRAGPGPVVLCSAVTAIVFVGVSLAANAHGIVAEPLPMLAVLAMQAGVTIASVALARAEIGHRNASIVDPLTGLLNRQGLAARFEELRQQALVTAAPISLVLFDLDHFKQVNDTRGHDVGDRLLVELADEVRRTLRTFELVYRVGGEEFLILLPGMEEWEGASLAEQLRLTIEALGRSSGTGVTASFGIAAAESEADFDRLYRQADQALYRAKRAGRDRVETSDGAGLELRL